jgi:hypothetical protein
MMVDQTVSITLDRERSLRYSLGDVKDICRVLTRMEPGEQPRKVTQGRLYQLLVERDIDAIVQTVFHGLRWEDRALRAERVEQIVGDFLVNGGDMVVIYDAIVEAWQKAGLAPRPTNQPTNGASGNGSTASDRS